MSFSRAFSFGFAVCYAAVNLWAMHDEGFFKMEKVTVIEHFSFPTSIAMDSSSKFVVVADNHNVARVFDVETGKHIRDLVGHKMALTYVAFKPNSTTLAIASKDKTISLWNVKSGRNLHVLSGHIDWVDSVSFSNRNRVLSTDVAGNAIVWDLVKKEQVFRFGCQHAKAHDEKLEGHECTGPGLEIAVLSSDGNFMISNSNSFHNLQPLSVDLNVTGRKAFIIDLNPLQGWFEAAAISPDSNTVAISGFNKKIYLYNKTAQGSLRELADQNDSTHQLTFSKHGQWLASVSSTTVKVRQVKDGTVRATFNKPDLDLERSEDSPEEDKMAVQFSNSNAFLAINVQGRLFLYETESFGLLHMFGHRSKRVLSIAFGSQHRPFSYYYAAQGKKSIGDVLLVAYENGPSEVYFISLNY